MEVRKVLLVLVLLLHECLAGHFNPLPVLVQSKLKTDEEKITENFNRYGLRLLYNSISLFDKCSKFQNALKVNLIMFY